MTLRAPGAGTYRLRIDRIGWSGILTDAFHIGAGETIGRELSLEATRVELPTLVVSGKTRCESDRESGSLAAALWEEIRKALTANVLTQRSRKVPLLVREFSREVDLTGRVAREWVFRSAITTGAPFAALSPQVLAGAGFVQEINDSALYLAPDAELLLSDQFVTTHCFRSLAPADGLLGLGFEPVPNRKIPDVRGTLWVDPLSKELRFLEYSYTSLENTPGSAELGGRIEFRQLPSGAWIVSYWHIRMPRVIESFDRRRADRRPQAVLVGYLDRGGRVDVVADAKGNLNRAIVIGRVHDSTTGGGLAGAWIRAGEHADSVSTSGDGRFELAVPLSGVQTVAASHPKLQLARIRDRQDALLSIGDTVRIDFAVPSATALARAFCRQSRGGAGVVGIVWGTDGRPLEGADVRVKWLSAGGSREERSRSGTNGAFALCNLTTGPTLPVRLHNGLQVHAEQPVRLAWGEFRWLDLRMPDERGEPK